MVRRQDRYSLPQQQSKEQETTLGEGNKGISELEYKNKGVHDHGMVAVFMKGFSNTR